tara:strand:+ start:53 stop:289 length:237 start_codon:yes stop_codon:yes gene_type:complete
MRFKIYDRAVNILTGKECIILSTKDEPYKPKNDFMYRKEIKPDDGFNYLIMTKISDYRKEINYSGLTSVMDNQLDKIK